MVLKRWYEKRHVTENKPFSKAQQTLSSDCLGCSLVPTAEVKLEPLTLKSFFKKSIGKLAQDEGYPHATLSQGTK